MKVDEQLISRLEKLARLKLSSSERSSFVGDLNNILGMIEKLQELDLDDVEPLVYVNADKMRLRPDVKQGEVTQEEALYNAPDHDGRFFKVPKVIK